MLQNNITFPINSNRTSVILIISHKVFDYLTKKMQVFVSRFLLRRRPANWLISVDFLFSRQIFFRPLMTSSSPVQQITSTARVWLLLLLLLQLLLLLKRWQRYFCSKIEKKKNAINRCWPLRNTFTNNT